MAVQILAVEHMADGEKDGGARPVDAAASLGPGEVGRHSRYLGWARKGGLSIIDQGMFAGANFVLNILLARWLAPAEFGAFTLGYSLFLFIGAFYLAFFMEPFLIFASGKHRGSFGRYYRLIMACHWRVTAAVAIIVAVAALAVDALGHRGQAQAVLGFGLALPFVLQMWLMRTVFYSRTQPHCSAAGSAIFFVCQVGGVCVLHAYGWLNPLIAFLVSGVASCIAGFSMRGLLGRLSKSVPSDTTTPIAPTDDREFRGVVLADHLHYAKWASGVSVIAWLCANVHYFILSSAGGLVVVGSMKVLDNLLTPFYQCISALGQLLMPMVSARAGVTRNFIHRTFGVAAVWFSMAVVAYAGLWWFGEDLLRLLFGPSFVELAHPLRIFALVVFPYTISMALMLGCRAKVRTDLVFLYHVLFAATLTAAYLAMSPHGLLGIVWSNVGTRLVFLPVILVIFLKAAHGQTKERQIAAAALN